jgi:acyl carrier protein
MSVKTAQETVMEILEEFAEDWGLDEIEMSSETFLKADLGFESTDTMQLFTAVQENYPAMKFTFQDLVVREEKFVDDLQIKEIVSFIQSQLQSSMKKLQEG